MNMNILLQHTILQRNETPWLKILLLYIIYSIEFWCCRTQYTWEVFLTLNASIEIASMLTMVLGFKGEEEDEDGKKFNFLFPSICFGIGRKAMLFYMFLYVIHTSLYLFVLLHDAFNVNQLDWIKSNLL